MKEGFVRKAFKGEVEILKELSHPSIIKLFAVIEEPKTINVVMEHVNGVSMQTFMRNKNI